MSSKKFTLTFDIHANVGPIKNEILRIQQLLSNSSLNIPIDIKANAEKTIRELLGEIDHFSKKAEEGIGSLGEMKQVETSFRSISRLFQSLKKQVLKMDGIDPQKFLPKETQDRLKQLTEKLEEVEQLEKKRKKQERNNKTSENLKKVQEERRKIIEAERSKNESLWTQNTQDDEIIKSLQEEYYYLKLIDDQVKKTGKKRKQFTKEDYEQAEEAVRDQLPDQFKWNKERFEFLTPAFSGPHGKKSNSAIAQQITDLQQTIDYAKKASEAFEALRQAVQGYSSEKVPEDLEQLVQFIEKLQSEELQKVAVQLKSLLSSFGGSDSLLDNFGEGLAKGRQEIEAFTRASDDMARLKNQIYDFFSVSNTIQIFKNAIRDAFETVKELDAVMTETAVVTDFTVGDMWEKLPEYAAQATKLGASIKSLYEATTLYYQQGLNSEQAMSVGSETMKMARIANMDAADATEAMTAALRGFNMEIDQTSATRVNDVYSELAAITAADTSQIATAMTKTASIAASANMEFETTAAFLAQIIETTQEAPETAGTAMKTIIARFTEVKKLFDKGMLTGEDEEGEVIEINKIDTALKSVGISLKDFLLGSKGIDDIFLELASKWDSLDLATQRYIATTAAGSRQQSRFIAMMSDYERTMELVTAANNSAGAGQRQFDKTLESLESKLQGLSNAWDQFVMNLANSTIIKAGIDTLTFVLETINKIIDSLSGGNGLISSFVTLGAVIAAMKGGNAILTGTLHGVLKGAGVPVNQRDNVPMRTPFKFQAPTEQTMGYGALSWLGSGVQKVMRVTPNLFANYQDKQTIKRKTQEEETSQDKTDSKPSSQKVRVREKTTGETVGKTTDRNVNKILQQVNRQKQQEDAREAEEKLAKEQLENSHQATQVTADALTAIGLVGGGLAMLADEAGFEELGEGIGNVSTAMVGLGQGLSLLNSVAALAGTTLGAMMTTLGPWILGIAAVASALVFVGKQIYDNSYAGRIKQAEENTATSESAAEHAANSFEKISDSFENIFKQSDNIKNMVEGTSEWLEATSQLNSDISSLVQKDSQLLDIVEYSNGLLDLNREKAAQYLKEEKLESIRAKNATNRIAQQEREIRIEQKYFETGLTESQQNYRLDPTKWNANYGVIVSTKFDEEATKNLAKLLVGVSDEQLIDRASEVMAFNAGQMRFGGDSWDQEAQLTFLKELREVGKTLTSVEDEQTPEAIQYERQISDNIKQQAGVQGTLDDFSQNLDSTLVKNMSDSFYEEFLGKFGEVTETHKEQYARLMNYTYDYFSGKFFDSENKEVTGITDDVIKFTLVSEQADEAAASKLSTIDESFNTQEQRDKAQELLSEEGQDLSWKTISELQRQLDEQGGNFANAFKDIFGVTIDTLASNMKVDPADLEEELQGNLEKGKKRIAKQREGLVANMSKYTKGGTEESTKNLATLENRFGDEGRDMLESVFSSLGRSGDKSIIGAGYENFITAALAGSKEEVQELSDFISQIDWSNPIEAASKLKSETKVLNGLTSNFSKKMLSLKTGFLGTASQMRYFIDSADFTDVQEDLGEILQTSEEISAADVLDLADSYQSLNKILKNTEASAGGVAKALDAIAKKQIKAEDLTDAVMAALQGYDSLGSMIAKLSHDLGNFDPGVDENIATEFVAQAYEVLNANLEKGAFGNNQNFKYLDYMFGNNWRTDAEGNALSNDQIAQQMQYYAQALGKNSENMENAWTNLASGYDFTGRQRLTSTQKDQREAALGGLSVERKGGEILLSGYEGMTTQDIVSRIAKGYGVSETFASMMVADYKNYSKDFRFNMATQEADMNQVAANTLKGMATFGDSMVIDQQSINTIASLWGFNADNFSSILQELVSKEGKTLQTSKFYDDQGNFKESSEIQEEMNKVTGKSGYFDDNTFKYDEFMRDAEALGLSEAQSDQVAQDLIDAQIEASGKPVELEFDADKGIEKVSVDAGEKVSEEVSAGYEKAANESLATTFFNYLNKNPLPVQVVPQVEGGEIVEQGTAILGADTTQVTEAVAGLNLSSIVSLIPSIDFTGFGFFAKGVTNAPASQPALVGEKGPELIERADGTAYLSGTNGPEITHIGVGDTVHTAEETSRIFRRNKGYTMPRFEGGTTSHGYGKTSGGKLGSSDKVENPFDKLYNLVREIDEELRQRERIERRYEKLLESLNESANQIIQVSREELTQLEYERKLQEKLVEGRKEQIKLYQQERKNMTKYGWTEENDRGETVLRIDWDKIDAVSNKKEMGEIQKYVSQLEEWFDSLKEAEDALWDIEDAVEEIKDRGQEEYDDLEKAISEALTKAYQDEIDKLSEINDSINETNSSLMESIQKSIDKMRQDRENERTEEELGEKQRQLLYLQQDTSGANQLEILKLQEELEQGQEDYTDTLIDQKISELQEQNEEASKQREQQITLLQAQLDHYVESGEIWKEVYELMDNGLDKDSGLLRGSRLEEILQNADNFKGLSVIGQMDWWTDMNGMIAQALAYLEVGRQLEDIGVEEGKEVEFKTESGDVIKGTVDAQGNVVDANGYIYDNVFQGADGKYYAGKNIKSQEELKPVEKEPESKIESEENKDQSGSNGSGGGYKYQDSRGKWWKTKAEADAANKKYIEEETAKRQSEYWEKQNNFVSALLWEGGREKRQEEYWENHQIMVNTITSKQQGQNQARTQSGQAEIEAKAAAAAEAARLEEIIKRGNSGYTKYATGGLADFTGPAWLDGTKARPELVLNARDTQNFIQLKDILGSIMNRGSFSNTSTENNGDITYDIDINVESVDNDYDVEKIANKVKSLINDNARYRNNNAISLRR